MEYKKKLSDLQGDLFTAGLAYHYSGRKDRSPYLKDMKNIIREIESVKEKEFEHET